MYKIELIQNFELFDVDVQEIEHSQKEITSIKPRLKLIAKQSCEFSCNQFYDFPVLVDEDGSLWVDAALFLLEYLKGISPPPSGTLLSVAYDLLAFGNWLSEEEVDYLDINSEHQRALPTYRFTFFLQNNLRLGKLAVSTSRRRINTVCRFYTWLQKTNKIPNRQLWVSEKRLISYSHDRGHFQKHYESNNLSQSLKLSKATETSKREVLDGGRLRPLRTNEIIALRSCLNEIENVEMSLAIDIALCTGARLETVFTLREGNFILSETDTLQPTRILIGGNSLVANKNDKQMVLHIPSNINKRMMIYLKSAQRKKRLSYSNHNFPTPENEYAFLTKSGFAYYISKTCPNRKNYKFRPTGNSITQFFHGTLRRKLVKEGFHFPLKFHDLRATFGTRLIAWEQLNRENSKLEPFAPSEQLYLLNYVKERLGHSSVETTLRYISFVMEDVELKPIQDDYEEFLLGEEL